MLDYLKKNLDLKISLVVLVILVAFFFFNNLKTDGTFYTK